MAFNLNDIAELTALNGLFRRQEAAVKTAILVWRNGQPFAFRQRKQGFRFGKRWGERFFPPARFFPASSARLA